MNVRRIICLWMLLGGTAQASPWSDLWYRQDQQGQSALTAGDSKRAAELFTDPRRRAYAQIQAQQYAAAAQGLKPFGDALSQYNRGNALAKSGDLQEALSAYDGTLEHSDLESSLRRDAQRNRDLIARQLDTQKHQSASSGQHNQKSQAEKSNDASGAGSSNPPPAAGSASPQKDGRENQQAADEHHTAQPSQPQQSQSESGDKQRDASERAQSGKHQDAPSPEQSQKPAEEQPANAGRQESSPVAPSQERTVGESSRPQTEQQLALEQWLRQIPDDPGGLLRRKFLIEHLMKQQQAQP